MMSMFGHLGDNYVKYTKKIDERKQFGGRSNA